MQKSDEEHTRPREGWTSWRAPTTVHKEKFRDTTIISWNLGRNYLWESARGRAVEIFALQVNHASFRWVVFHPPLYSYCNSYLCTAYVKLEWRQLYLINCPLRSKFRIRCVMRVAQPGILMKRQPDVSCPPYSTDWWTEWYWNEWMSLSI